MLTKRRFLQLLGLGVATNLLHGSTATASPRASSQSDPVPQGAYAGVITFQFDPNRIEEASALWETSVYAAAARQGGLLRAVLLTNRETGKALGIGLWASQADSEAFGASGAFQAAVAPMAPVLVAPLVREQYEVSRSPLALAISGGG